MPKQSMANMKSEALSEDLVTVQSAARTLEQLKRWMDGLQCDHGATHSELRHSLDLAWMSATRLACELAQPVKTQRKPALSTRR